MSYVHYVDSSQFQPRRSPRVGERYEPERTLLGKAIRWIAEKSLNSILDIFLRMFLAGPWYVRLAGSILTGVVASSTIWVVYGAVLPNVVSVPAAVVTIGIGAVAGFVMGYTGGLLAGGGAAWLVSAIAESIGTELSKDPLDELRFNSLVVWCLSTVVGGLVGWGLGMVVDYVERRSTTAGYAIRALSYLLIFVAATLVLIRTGASGSMWAALGFASNVGTLSDALAIGVFVGMGIALVAILYVLWCYLPSPYREHLPIIWLTPQGGRFARIHLPLLQASVIAMIWTLSVVDSASGSSAAVTILLSVVVWIVPWIAVLASAGVMATIRNWR